MKTTEKSARTHWEVIVPEREIVIDCPELVYAQNRCGHHHRTHEAAEKCLRKLQAWRNNECDAAWYHGVVRLIDTAQDHYVDE